MDWSIFLLLSYIVDLLVILILIDVVLTWIPSVDQWHPLVLTLRKITSPLYAPIQRILPPSKTGNIDISPLIVVLILRFGLRVIGSILF